MRPQEPLPQTQKYSAIEYNTQQQSIRYFQHFQSFDYKFLMKWL